LALVRLECAVIGASGRAQESTTRVPDGGSGVKGRAFFLNETDCSHVRRAFRVMARASTRSF